jgi:hypothetical protein
MKRSSEHEDDINLKKNGIYKEKRVSLPTGELINKLMILFKQKKEYRLNDLVDILNHPVQPLKATLNQICDFKKQEKVYVVK